MLEQLASAEAPAELTVRKRVISKKKHAAQFAVERLQPTEEAHQSSLPFSTTTNTGARQRALSRFRPGRSDCYWQSCSTAPGSVLEIRMDVWSLSEFR